MGHNVPISIVKSCCIVFLPEARALTLEPMLVVYFVTYARTTLDFQERGLDGAGRDVDEYKRASARTFCHILMNCTFLLTLTGLRQRLPDPLPELPRDQRCLALFCGFAFVVFYFVFSCPPIRVDPVCFVMFFRTIKIHHHAGVGWVF